MAKKSAINRNETVKRLVAKFEAKREALKAIANDETLSLEERFEARPHLTLLFVTKDHADCGEFAILRFEDSTERDGANC
jgi:hypothetical protein